MRQLTTLTLGLLGLFLICAGARPALAFCIDSGGFPHCTLGTAILTPDATGVEVTHFSLSGQDGLGIDLSPGGGADSVSNAVVMDPDATGDAYLVTTTYGVSDGQYGPLLTTTVRRLGNDLYVSADYPGSYADSLVVAILDDQGQIVALFEDLPDGSMVRLPAGPQLRQAGVQRSRGSLGTVAAPFTEVHPAAWENQIDPTRPWSRAQVDEPWWYPWRDVFWDVFGMRVPDQRPIDVLGDGGAVIGSAVGSQVALTAKGPDVARGPIYEQTFTGAGLDSLSVGQLDAPAATGP